MSGRFSEDFEILRKLGGTVRQWWNRYVESVKKV